MNNGIETYYKHPLVVCTLLQHFKNREIVFLNRETGNCIRMLYFSEGGYFNKFQNYVDFYTKEYTIYMSVAKFNFIPHNRKQKDIFFSNIHNYINDYDILLDFDSDSQKQLNILRTEVYKFRQILDKYLVPYLIFPSSTSGIQLRIEGKYLDYPIKTFGSSGAHFNILTRHIILNIKDKFKLTTLCIKGVGGLTKLMKCPYTYNFASGNFCIPFRPKKNYGIFTKPSEAIKHMKTKRSYDDRNIIDLENNTKNTMKFLKEGGLL